MIRGMNSKETMRYQVLVPRGLSQDHEEEESRAERDEDRS
jgi:hypothetical protein